MSAWPHDTPAPGRFSLGRVVAARLGHARRRAEPAGPMVQMQGRDAWPARRCSPEMAVYDPTEDDKREDMNGYEAMALVAAVIVSAVFSTWALCAFANHLAGLL